MITEIESTLEEGRGAVVFPEGTSSAGASVLPFKPSLFEVAATSSTPVSCGAIRYRTFPGERPAQWSICWWGGMEFGAHFLAMLGMKGFEVFLSFSETRVEGDDRKQLAEAARAVVSSVFTPTCDAAAVDEGEPGDAR